MRDYTEHLISLAGGDGDGPSGMAEVLIEHQRHRGGCLCGWDELGKSHPAHQAAALSAAGFGPVTEAKAAALEQAAAELEQRAKNVQNNTYLESDIYSELTHRADALLGAAKTVRARATAVRGEV
jgi:hypothetical protein